MAWMLYLQQPLAVVIDFMSSAPENDDMGKGKFTEYAYQFS